MTSSNDRKRLEKAEQAVAALEARRAEREDEAAILTAETALLSEQIAAADARGEPVTALAAERERRLQRQRDLAAVLPLLEQQLAEARAERDAVRLQVASTQHAENGAAWRRRGRAWHDDFLRNVLGGPLGEGALGLLDDLAALEREEEEVAQLSGRRVRGWTVKDHLIEETGLLLQMLIVVREWKAGRPIQVQGPGHPQARPAGAPDAVEARMLQAGVRWLGG